MSIDLGSTLNTLITGIINIGKTQLNNYLPQVETDAQSIANALKGNLQTWTDQLASGAITADDLQFLIAGGEEYLAIAALTQAGIAVAQLDQFKQSVANLVVKTLTALIP